MVPGIEVPAERTGLECMLEARSVAVVGASVKDGSLGRQMMIELLRGGYDGAIYPVNPGYEDVLGHKCYPAIGDVPEPVDLVILGVANARIEQALMDAATAGAEEGGAGEAAIAVEDEGAPGWPAQPDPVSVT